MKSKRVFSAKAKAAIKRGIKAYWRRKRAGLVDKTITTKIRWEKANEETTNLQSTNSAQTINYQELYYQMQRDFHRVEGENMRMQKKLDALNSIINL